MVVFENQCVFERVIVPIFGEKTGFSFGLVNYLLYNFFCL